MYAFCMPTIFSCATIYPSTNHLLPLLLPSAAHLLPVTRHISASTSPIYPTRLTHAAAAPRRRSSPRVHWPTVG